VVTLSLIFTCPRPKNPKLGSIGPKTTQLRDADWIGVGVPLERGSEWTAAASTKM